jgi:hypothetical protein
MRRVLLWIVGIVLLISAAGFVGALAVTHNWIYIVPAAVLGTTAKLALSKAAGVPFND